MKEVLVTNGNNECRGYTKATTEAGYLRAAKRIWYYTGLNRVKIIIYDPKAEGDKTVFEEQVDLS